MPRLEVDELLQSGGGQSLTSISSQGVRLGILGRQVDGELYTNILLFFNGTRWSSQSFQIPDQRTNSYLLADRLVVGGSVALLFSGAGNADRSSRVWYVDLAQLNSQNPELIEIAAPDGQSWGDLVAGSYGAGAFVLVGRAGKIHRISESAPSEVQRVDSGLSASLSGVAYGDKSGGRWVAVGACGTVLYSTSSRGDQWMQAPVRVLDDLNAVTYGAGTFLAVGEGGVILQSN
jgi:hypothetical protein